MTGTSSSILVFMLVMAFLFSLLFVSEFATPISSIEPRIVNDNNGQIAFISTREGSTEIIVMNADGSNQHNISNNTFDDSPSWSPDGRKIALTRYLPDNSSNDSLLLKGEIFVMNADGSNQQQLTNNTVDDSNPTWSPDGSKIAFVSTKDGIGAIIVMNSDGSNQQNISVNATGSVMHLTWSPDGSKIAYDSIGMYSDDGTFEIYVMNSDGSNQQNISQNSAVDLQPSWSPDARKIAFVSNRDGDDEIYVMNSDGTNQQNISVNATGSDSNPTWSPDGSKIAFVSNRNYNPEIYVMNSDGNNQIRMSHGSNNTWNTGPNWGTYPNTN